MKTAKQAALKHMVSRDFIVMMSKGIIVHETSSVSPGILENSMIYSIHYALLLKRKLQHMGHLWIALWSLGQVGQQI